MIVVIISARTEWNVLKKVYQSMPIHLLPFGELGKLIFECEEENQEVTFIHGGRGKVKQEETMLGKRESLKTIVGQETYNVWTQMLHSLVPNGRTHRLAPMVAGMLQYAATVAHEKYGDDPEEGSVAHSLLLASEVYDPQEAIELFDLIKQLFEDAEVEYERVSHRGDGYSIADNITYEFIHWYDMPWES